MIKKIRKVIDDLLLEGTLVKVRELIKTHIDSGDRLMYWVSSDSEKKNVMNMIRFFEIAFEDGDMANGKYFDTSVWMSSNPELVWEMYIEMKVVAE